MNINPNIEESWKQVLQEEFEKPYFENIKKRLTEDINNKIAVYPPGPVIFNAFNSTPFPNVKIVILGQDPYHGPGQSHGLCFSVQEGVALPPSLKNIFKELNNDLNVPVPPHGNLTGWAQQGVLLLNAFLTVCAGRPCSHQDIGWQYFTDAVIKKLSAERSGLVFMLWGKFAQNKAMLIDEKRHHILKAAHPSPLSAHNGFFGCKHFSRANELLRHEGYNTIDWSLTN